MTEEKIEEKKNKSPITIGKDILELLSSGMYLDPLTIYREYIQNCCDSIEDALKQGIFADIIQSKVDVNVNYIDRSVSIIDNGAGIPKSKFLKTLLSFGNSSKRGTSARGFRGIGRLAGLAYCQELIFTSKYKGEDEISVLKWDCRKIKSLLTDHEIDLDLAEIVEMSTSSSIEKSENKEEHFFKVEMKKIIRLKNDILLNSIEIEQYISQTAPVPFSDKFKFKNEIKNMLKEYFYLPEHNIYLNGNERITRLYRNTFEFSSKTTDEINSFEKVEVTDNDNNVLAVGFLLHHSYLGAIHKNTKLSGLRARVGNIQIGNNLIFLDLYPEIRFNSWTIGELHVLSEKLIPNGRRDDFEKNNQYYNFQNYVTLTTKRIADICRNKSQIRNQEKIVDFTKVKHNKKQEAVNNIIKVAKNHVKDEKKIKEIQTAIFEELSKF
jgi:hypothetical protein